MVSHSKILFLFPTPVRSHMIPVHALSTALARRGHQVTVLSAFPCGEKISNHREILINFDDEKFNRKIFEDTKKSPFERLKFVLNFTLDLSNQAIKMEEFQRVLSEENFDLVVVGISLVFNSFLLGFGDHFKCPTVVFSIHSGTSFISSITGSPYEIASAPSMILSPTGMQMNFKDRLANLLLFCCEKMMEIYIHYVMESNYKTYFPSTKYRSYKDSLKNISLALVNGHFTQTRPRPNAPNVVEVGGIHIKPEPESLPKEIKEWLDDSPQGVIYFNLGSVVDVSLLSSDAIETFMNVFKKLDQRVIMKWKTHEFAEKPKNIMIAEWLPQVDILAHPNVKAFISHCGLGSVTEARYFAVPIIAIPLCTDEFKNANDVVNEGWAKMLDLKTLSEENLLLAINEILHNESYSKTIKKLSNIYRDRPMSAKDTAIYWIEYVIKHRGAPHLQFSAVHQNFITRNLIDVFVFLFGVILIVFYCSCLIIN